MANRIKLGLISSSPEPHTNTFDQAAVDWMLEDWRKRLTSVLHDRPDMIVLPECCDRCWPATATKEQFMQFYETRGDQLLDMFAGVAAKHRCHIAWSSWRKAQDGTWRNSIQIVNRKGELAGIYDKHFPVIGEMELGIVPGSGEPLIECDFGNVACSICFDLNFDEVRSAYAAKKPDLILFSSVYHGGLMQAYWAYSCRAHLASSVARLPSQVYSPVGNLLATTTNYMHHVVTTINLDCRVVHLDNNWVKFADIKEKYGPDVSIYDPGHLAPVVISSESDQFTADDLVNEYQLELLDDYFDRSRAVREKYLPGQVVTV